MALDPVPWFVGGGAQHSPEVARLLAYAATGGAEGVVEPGDLKVTPLSVPGGAVQALPGAALVRNRGAGGDSQTYVARNVTATQVEIAATGSSGGRSDLVVVQVEDPNVAGEPWQTPADPAAGPYVFVRVIPNVPAGTTRLQDVPGYEGRSAVTLARVDLPASTGTVTAAMIKDLRRLARPRAHREVQYEQVSPYNQDLTSSSFVQYPNTEPYFEVPEWATGAFVQFRVLGLAVVGGPVAGFARLQFGTSASLTAGGERYFDFDDPTGGVSRIDLEVGGYFDIPPSDRGQMRIIRMQARRSGGTGLLRTHAGTQAVIDIQFYERAV